MVERRFAFLTVLAIAAAFWALPVADDARAASFDCAKANTPPEIAICKDTGLSALDEELADLYRKALAATKRPNQKRQLENQQARFLERQRARCENDIPCLTRVYESRIAQLRHRTGQQDEADRKNVDRRAPKASSFDAVFAPVWDIPENPASPAAGFWLANVKCGKGSAEAVILIAEGTSSSGLEGSIKYYAPELPQPHASGFSLLAGRKNGDGSYDFATDNRPSYSSRGASGQTLGAFNARISDGRLEGRFSGGSCESFSAGRLRPDSDYLRAARTDGLENGTFNQGDRCKAVLDWMARLETQLPPDWYTGKPLEEIMPLASMMYADDEFIPIFGTPYDQTSREWRRETGRWIQVECLGDRITRGKLIRYSGFLHFSDLDFLKTEPRVRQIRRLRYQLAGIREALAEAPLDKAAQLADQARGLTQTFGFLLWPHEVEAMTKVADDRLAMLARPEADAILARLETATPGLKTLLETDGVLANFDSQVFGYLPPDERETRRERLQARRSVIAAGTVEPILARARATTADLEGFNAIARLQEEESGLITRLPVDVRQSLDHDLGALRQERIQADVSAMSGSLDTTRPAGKAALEASAAWKTGFDQRYGSLTENPAVSAAASLYRDHRKELLLASIDEFAEELARLSPREPGSREQALALMRTYMGWDGDRTLPQSLEYRFAINEWSPASDESDEFEFEE